MMRDRRHSTLLIAMAWLVLSLMILPKDFIDDFTANPGQSAIDVGLTINWCLWLFLLCAGPVLIAGRMAAARTVLHRLNPYFIAFFFLAWASLIWSPAQAVTLERCRRLLVLDVFSLAFVIYSWRPHRFQEAVRPILLILLVASLLQGMLLPELAITQSDAAELRGAWRGLTAHKNIFGSLATYGVIFYLHGWLARELRPLSALIGLAVAITCLVLSRSSTSLLGSGFSIGLLLLLLRSPASARRYMPYIIGFFVLLVATYALVALGFIPALQSLLEPITALTGKQAGTATGRAPIWALVEAEITRHRWLGIGYGAYWIGAIPGTASYVFLAQVYFYPWSAHNGYLEITNDLGYVGLVCLLGYLYVYLRDSLQLWKLDRNQAALFLALLFQQGLENLSESGWLQVGFFNFAVMTLATFALARALADAKQRSVPGAAPHQVAATGSGARSSPAARPRRARPANPSDRSRHRVSAAAPAFPADCN